MFYPGARFCVILSSKTRHRASRWANYAMRGSAQGRLQPNLPQRFTLLTKLAQARKLPTQTFQFSSLFPRQVLVIGLPQPTATFQCLGLLFGKPTLNLPPRVRQGSVPLIVKS
jgi:hypothetical protein